MSDIEKTDNGDIIFLARAAGQVADQGASSGVIATRGSKSGNPKFDPKTGKFAGGKTSDVIPRVLNQNPTPVTRSGIPQGVTEEEWNRRLDTVRDAAREMDTMAESDATDFLKGRVNDISKIDLAQFIKDVRAQRLDDLTDIFDAQLRSKIEGMRRARRVVRMAAPKGWVKRVFASLEDNELLGLVSRLESRGYKRADLIKNIVDRVSDMGRRDTLKSSLGVKTNVKLEGWVGIRPSSDDFVELEDDDVDAIGLWQQTMPQMFADAIRSIPAPVVNVEPHITVEAPKPTRKVVHHDPVTKRITHVDEVSIDE